MTDPERIEALIESLDTVCDKMKAAGLAGLARYVGRIREAAAQLRADHPAQGEALTEPPARIWNSKTGLFEPPNHIPPPVAPARTEATPAEQGGGGADAAEGRTVPPVADVGLFGPVNGMDEPDRSGSYIRVVMSGSQSNQRFRVSIGAAEVLVGELSGLLYGHKPEGQKMDGTEPRWQTLFYDWVKTQPPSMQAAGIAAQIEEYLRLFPERKRPKQPLPGTFTCSRCNKPVDAAEVWWVGCSQYHKDCVQ